MKKLMIGLRRRMALWLDPSIAKAVEYYRDGWKYAVEDANGWYDYESESAERKRLAEELHGTEKMVEHLCSVNGIVEAVSTHLCSGLKGLELRSGADSIELYGAIRQFCSDLRMELDSCEMLKTYSDYHDVKWGHRVRRACGTMFAISQKHHLKLLGAFARIWRKGHPDQRQKDVMTPSEVTEWNKLPKKYKELVNEAIRMKTF